MIIKTWVHLEDEVSVNVSMEEVTAALLTDVNGVHSASVGINNCGTFLKSVPDTVIGKMTVHARLTIANFLIAQAARFKE